MAADIGRPEFLPRRQVLYLDAIEESFRMASLAYERLQESLAAKVSSYESPDASSPKESDEMSRLDSAILLDAWSLVDVLNRLRVLVDSMPGLKKSSPGVKSLRHSLAPIEDLRNSVQHLYGQVQRIADKVIPSGGAFRGLLLPRSPAILSGLQLSSLERWLA